MLSVCLLVLLVLCVCKQTNQFTQSHCEICFSFVVDDHGAGMLKIRVNLHGMNKNQCHALLCEKKLYKGFFLQLFLLVSFPCTAALHFKQDNTTPCFYFPNINRVWA